MYLFYYKILYQKLNIYNQKNLLQNKLIKPV